MKHIGWLSQVFLTVTLLMACNAVKAHLIVEDEVIDDIVRSMLLDDMEGFKETLKLYLSDDSHTIDDRVGSREPRFSFPSYIGEEANFISAAIILGRRDIVKYLLEQGAKKDIVYSYFDGNKINLVGLAAVFNRPSVILVLKKYNVPGFNAFFLEDQNPLLKAIKFNQLELVRVLLEAGVLVKDDKKITGHEFNAMNFAIKVNNVEIVKELLATGKFSGKEVMQFLNIAKELAKGNKAYNKIVTQIARYITTKKITEEKQKMPPEIVEQILEF